MESAGQAESVRDDYPINCPVAGESDLPAGGVESRQDACTILQNMNSLKEFLTVVSYDGYEENYNGSQFFGQLDK